MSKTRVVPLAFLAFLCLPVLAMAQDTPPNWADVGINAITALVAPLTAAAVYFIRLGLKKLPRAAIPVIVPIIGVAIDFLLAQVTGGAFNPVAGALLGALGTWVREAIHTPLEHGLNG